jgi:uncharacterized protein (TIGR03067 family)
MKRILALVLLSTATISVGAPVPWPKPNLKRMQGEWVLVRRFIDGRERSRPESTTVTIESTRMAILTSTSPSSFSGGEWEITVYARHLDMKGPGNILLGLYRIEGDTMTICFSDKHRPTRFDGSKTGVQLWVLHKKP